MQENGTVVIATALLMTLRSLSAAEGTPSSFIADNYNRILDEAKRSRPDIPESAWPSAVDAQVSSMAEGREEDSIHAETIRYGELESRVMRILANLRKAHPSS